MNICTKIMIVYLILALGVPLLLLGLWLVAACIKFAWKRGKELYDSVG